MIRRLALSLWLFLLAHYAWADAATQRFVPGMSLSLQGELLDLNAPICTPAAGSYSVQYRNSIATGCSGRGSDDFATLVFTGGSSATYTMPQSSVTTFTGSISGTTLTTPSNAVVIGSVITDPGTGKVLDNTYVVSGSGTTWTINQSQTVSSETLTQSVFPPGHGVCFKNHSETNSNGGAPLIVAATTSTIYGAAGNISGNPGAQGGSIALFPGGELCLQVDPSNNYLVSDYNPGVWYQFGNNVSALQWTGLPAYTSGGYVRYTIDCAGITPTVNGANLDMQIAYAGTYQATGYNYNAVYNFTTTITPFSNSNDTKVPVTGGVSNNNDYGVTLHMDFAFVLGSGGGYNNSYDTTANYFDSGAGVPLRWVVDGIAVLTTSLHVTGIQLYFDSSSNISAGLCWLKPRPN